MWKTRYFLVTLFMTLFCVSYGHAETRADRVHRLAPGVTASIQLFRGSETGLSIPFHVVEIKHKAAKLQILDARRKDRTRASVETLVRESGATAAINGSFFLDDGTPLGLLISKGKQIGPVRNVDWGVFLLDGNGHPSLVHARDWKHSPDVQFALQSGPRLVVEGKALTFKPNIARRSAICIRKNDTILLVATARPMTLLELANLLQRKQSEGGLECHGALNLDGGSSTQLILPGAPRDFGIRQGDRVPIAIGVFPKL